MSLLLKMQKETKKKSTLLFDSHVWETEKQYHRFPPQHTSKESEQQSQNKGTMAAPGRRNKIQYTQDTLMSY